VDTSALDQPELHTDDPQVELHAEPGRRHVERVLTFFVAVPPRVRCTAERGCARHFAMRRVLFAFVEANNCDECVAALASAYSVAPASKTKFCAEE
jgi:hypothetical protein